MYLNAICDPEADSSLSASTHQESLLSDARACLGKADTAKRKAPTAKTEEKGHGRIETRVAVAIEAKGLAEHHELRTSKPSDA
jgi:hypothetical protein